MKHCVLLILLSFTVYAKTPSLDEMLSQMIVIGFEGVKEGDKWVDQVARDIGRQKISGVYLSEKNVQNPEQLKKLTHYLKTKETRKKFPLLVIVEEEGGKGSLLDASKGFAAFPSAYDMAKFHDIEEAEKRYLERAQELANAGINVNFAPVLELQIENVKTSPRSYSAHEEIVTTYALLFIDALRMKHIVPVVKYFPMAGKHLENDFSTKVNVTQQFSLKQLKPYYDLINFGKIQSVLMSHALNQELDAQNPAIFSSFIIQTLLREKMHFEGVVFAHNLRTPSIDTTIEFKKRIIRSIQAGADILVFGTYFSENASVHLSVTKIIEDAIKQGELSIERIERSYERIERLKQTLVER